MGIRMGYWDCKSCEKKRIPGPERQCEACGQPRGEKVQFYTDDAAPEIDDQELIKRARSGADWQCPYCGADNRAGTSGCVGCGASTDGAKSRQERVILDAPPPAPPVKKRGSLKWIAIALVAVVLGVWALFFRTTELTASVTQKTWEKTLVVERLDTTRGEAWSDEVPAGARPIDSQSKQKTVRVQDGTEKVKVGKKDLGNGFFEDVYEDKPRFVERQVTATWVRYEIDRWIQDQTLEERRTDGTEPPWPTMTPGPRRREGAKTSEIVLELRGSNGKTYRYTTGPEAASRYQVGDSYVADINAVGSVRQLR